MYVYGTHNNTTSLYIAVTTVSLLASTYIPVEVNRRPAKRSTKSFAPYRQIVVRTFATGDMLNKINGKYRSDLFESVEYQKNDSRLFDGLISYYLRQEKGMT